MAKDIVVNVDNSLSGVVEIWASEPMANGTHQTAPVFITSKRYDNGSVTLSGAQETPSDQSWHYRIIIRPAGRRCLSEEGSTQFRVYLPASVASPVQLTELIANHSAW